MSIFQALREGMRRVHHAKRVVLWIYLFNFVLALAPALALADLIRDSLGRSVVAETLRQDFDSAWYEEFKLEAKGLAETFDPTVLGAGAILNGLDSFLNGTMFEASSAMVGLGVIYLASWIFFAGGALQLYYSGDPPSRESFVAASARYFPRFLRLAVVAGVLYYSVYKYVLSGLRGFISEQTRELVDERIVFSWTASKYLLIVVLLLLVNVVFDYAKILTVIQNRRSMLLALVRAIRLVGNHFGKTAGLYLLVMLGALFFLSIYSFLPTKPWEQTWRGVTVTLSAGQLYIVSRIWIRLVFYGSQSALCAELLKDRTDLPDNQLPVAE